VVPAVAPVTIALSSTTIEPMISQPKNAAPNLKPRYDRRSGSVGSGGSGLSGINVTLVIARWAAARASS
jgi:hypothetical protein